MSAQVPNRTADAAAGANSVKRKAEDSEDGPERKIPKSDQVPNTTEPCISDVAEQIDMSPKGRALRLEQNRKAAMESRRRKKIMIEELQRSVVFFSRANGALRHQNDDLTRLLMKARSYIGDLEAGKKEGMASSMTVTQTTSVESGVREQMETSLDQAHAEAVAAQAAYESQGFPAAAARAAAQTMSGTSLLAEIPVAAAPAPPTAIPPMQTGATMQAMANFQQAATAAMQAAIQGMQCIPGVNMSLLAAAPVGANAQQAFTDTMTALAMQQVAHAAAAAAGQRFAAHAGMAFMTHPMLAWQPPYDQRAPAEEPKDPPKDKPE
jgi:hypothetical protein